MNPIPFANAPLAYGAYRALRNITVTIALSTSVMVGAAAAKPTTILALGDSLTAGYGLPEGDGLVPQLNNWLAAHGSTAVVINAGVSGDTTAGGLSRLEWSLTPDVTAMMVLLGGNDLLRALPPAASRASLEGILQGAKSHHLPVLLIGLKAPANYGADYKTAFDAIYPDLAREYGATLIENYFAPLGDATDSANRSGVMQGDGIHPNKAGVAKIVESLGPQVKAFAETVPKTP
jgi:acyl-CoA thioesterase I